MALPPEPHTTFPSEEATAWIRLRLHAWDIYWRIVYSLTRFIRGVVSPPAAETVDTAETSVRD